METIKLLLFLQWIFFPQQNYVLKTQETKNCSKVSKVFKVFNTNLSGEYIRILK